MGEVAFADGGRLQVPTEGTLIIEGSVSGSVALEGVRWKELTTLSVLQLLRAPEGLTFVIPEEYAGYEVCYANGCYWLTYSEPPPLVLALGEDTSWVQAPWSADNQERAPTELWSLPIAETLQTTVTAIADAVLRLETAQTVGSFTVADATQTLTLSGEKLSPGVLTVAGQLSATSSTLALPSDTTINGTLTYDVLSDSSVEMPAMTGTGTFIKTGDGTLVLNSGTEVLPTVYVKGGTLQLPSGSVWVSNPNYYPSIPNIVVEGKASVYLSSPGGIIVDTEAIITLREGGIFKFENGNTFAGDRGRDIRCKFQIENDGISSYASIQGSINGDKAAFRGAIFGKGLLTFEEGKGNAYTVGSAISDTEQPLSVRFADANNAITVSGASTYTGGTEIASAVTASNAEAFGRGPLTIASGAKLTVASGKTLNVHGALSGQGTVSGAVQLVEGASLDASVGVLTVDTLSVAEGVTVPVTLPEALPEDGKLLAWTAGPETADAFTAENLPSTARLVAKADGLYYEALTLADGVQETFKGLSEATQRALASAAFDAGATSIAAVSGENIDGALQCFEGALTVTVDDAQAAMLSVDYAFGIAAMKYNAAEGTFTVTAKVQGAAEAQTVTFASDTTVEVVVDETDEILASTSASVSELTLTIPSEKAATLLQAPTPIRVRVKK